MYVGTSTYNYNCALHCTCVLSVTSVMLLFLQKLPAKVEGRNVTIKAASRLSPDGVTVSRII